MKVWPLKLKISRVDSGELLLCFVLFRFILFVFVAFLSALDIYLPNEFQTSQKNAYLKRQPLFQYDRYVLSFENPTAWAQFPASSKMCHDLLTRGSRKLMKISLKY